MKKTLPLMTILRKKDQDYNILRDQVLRYYSKKMSLVDQLNLYVLRRCNFENLCILNANRFLENHRIPSLHTPFLCAGQPCAGQTAKRETAIYEYILLYVCTKPVQIDCWILTLFRFHSKNFASFEEFLLHVIP